MNLVLLKTTAKNNWFLLVIFTGVLCMYMGVMMAMYSPDDMDALMSMYEMLPQDMMKTMGFTNVFTDLTGFLASWLYGMLMIGFPMVYSIILGNRLVAKMVDNSSFAYLLSTPHSRVRIIMTQGVYAIVSVVVLFGAVFGFGIALSASMFQGLLDVGGFFRLNFTTMLVNATVMMICFFFSCLFNETRLSLGFGAGVPLLFFLMNLLGNASEDAAILKKISIYGWYDPVALVNGTDAAGTNLLYVGLIIVLFAGGVWVFNKKRLPL